MELINTQNESEATLRLVSNSPDFRRLDYLRGYDADSDSYQCTATFASNPLSCATVEDLLIEPVSHLVRTNDFRAALHAGLEEYDSNGVLPYNARHMNTQTRLGLTAMTTDIRRLTKLLQGEAAQTTEQRTVRTANDDQVVSYAREQLLTMNSAQLTALCIEFGMTFDQLGLHRRLHGEQDRPLRMYDLDELGINSVQLRSMLIPKLFTKMDLLSPAGVEVVKVHVDDVADLPDTYRQSGFGIRQGPNVSKKSSDWLPQWNVNFPIDGVAKREIVPVVSWEATGKPGTNYWQRTATPTWLGSSLQFDERSRTLTLFSPVAGSLLMAAGMGIKPEPEFLRKLFLPNYEARNDKNRRKHVPDTAIAGMPGYMMRAAVTREMMRDTTFKRLARLVVPPYDRMLYETMRLAGAKAFMSETPPRQWRVVGSKLFIPN